MFLSDSEANNVGRRLQLLNGIIPEQYTIQYIKFVEIANIGHFNAFFICCKKERGSAFA